MFGVGYVELIVLGIVAVILFGRKLPEVARSVGGSYAQFRQGLTEIQSSMKDVEVDLSAGNLEYDNEYDDVSEPTTPKFEPPVDQEATS